MQFAGNGVVDVRVLVFAVALGALLSGCVTNTVSELRADPASYDGVVQVKQSPDQVFRHLRGIAKNCLEQAPMGTPVVSESEFDTETNTGQIRQRMTAQQVLLNMSIIELAKSQADGTELKLYTIKGWRAIGVDMPRPADLTRWASGDKNCWVGR